MRRRIETPFVLYIFILLSSFFPLTVPAQTNPVVDIYQDMESGTPGSLLTSAQVAASSHGSGGTWSVQGSMWSASVNDKALPGPVTVSGQSYSGTGSKTWATKDDTSSSYVSLSTGNKNAMVISGFVTIGPAPGKNQLYDIIVVGVGSTWAVCQINSKTSATTLWIEVNDPSLRTNHSSEIPVTAGTTYWVSFKVNSSGGLAALDVFEINGWTRIGSVSANMYPGTVNLVRFGRADSHTTTSATSTYLDDFFVNWTDTTFPFLPAAAGGNTGGRIAGIPIENVPTSVWKAAGVPGGIPNRTSTCATLSPGATASQIQSAITACGKDQVVQLGAGTFNISPLTIGIKDNWVLRGAGIGKTILNISNATSALISIGGAPPWDGAWSNTVAITGGGVQGTSSVTVSDASAYNIGDMAVIDQENSGWIVEYGAGNNGSQTVNSDAVGKNRDGVRVQNHFCTITGKGGSTISFSPALPYSLESSRAPQLTKFGNLNNGAYYRGPQWAGLEDLTINGDSTPARGIQIHGTYAFWLKNIEVKSWGGLAGVWVRKSANFEMRGSYIHDPNTYSTDHGYGVQLDPATGSLITDNIIYNCQSTFLLQGGCDGNVIAYNVMAFGKYVKDPYTGEWLQHEINGNHSPFPSYNLFEGNYTGQFQSDYYYGPSGWSTLYRNRIPGNSSATTQRRLAVSIDAMQRYYSVVGNQLGERTAPSSIVLGLPGVTRSYAQPGTITWGYDPGSMNLPTPFIFRLGYPYSGNNGSGSGVALHDDIVKNSTFRHGNWDAASNSVTWDPSVSDHTLPNSLFLDSKPVWFGALAWPPYGPSAPSDPVSDLAKIPAGARLLGSQLPPAAPTNLIVTN